MFISSTLADALQCNAVNSHTGCCMTKTAAFLPALAVCTTPCLQQSVVCRNPRVMEVTLAMHDECLRSLLHKHCGYEVSCRLAHHASQLCLSNSLCCPPPDAAAAILVNWLLQCSGTLFHCCLFIYAALYKPRISSDHAQQQAWTGRHRWHL